MTASINRYDLQEFYLKAAQNTYAKDRKPQILTNPVLGKRFYYPESGPEENGLRYIDTYYTNGEFSFGETVLTMDKLPLWIMQYQGWSKSDDPEVIAFLKKALTEAYTQGQYLGGRGPLVFKEADLPPLAKSRDPKSPHPLVYYNNPGGDFEYFQGYERIIRYPWILNDLFRHRYWGMTLFEGDDRVHRGVISPWFPIGQKPD